MYAAEVEKFINDLIAPVAELAQAHPVGAMYAGLFVIAAITYKLASS